MKKYFPLTLKITVFSTTIILLTSILVATIVYSTTSTLFFNAAVKNLHNQSQLLSNDIESSFMKIVNNMNILVKTPPIQGIVRSTNSLGKDKIDKSDLGMWKSRLAIIFSSMLKANKNYTQIRYIGIANRGKEIVRVEQVGNDVFQVHDSVLQEKERREYFKKGSQLSQGSIMFSKISYNVERGKVQHPMLITLRAIMPVYTKKQKPFGVLVININIIRYLREILMRDVGNFNVILFNKLNDFFIFNKKAKTLRFFRGGEVLKNGLFGNKKIKTANQIIPFLIKEKNLVAKFYPIYANHHKDHKVLTLAIVVPKKVIKSEGRGVMQEILIWIIGICLLAALLTFLFTKKIMRPLTQMANAISESARLSSQKLSLPTHFNDEVGLLARAFQQKTKLLNQLALFDGLTGLPNRKNFIDHLEESFQRANRNSSKVAVIYIDINKFKKINDDYGHDYGDNLLIQFSQSLKQTVRHVEFGSRLGGDEFAVIVEDIKSQDQLGKLLNRYRDMLNKTYIIKGITFNVTVSGGVAIYPHDATKPNELLQKADAAMYQSKKEGQGNFHFYKKDTTLG